MKTKILIGLLIAFASIADINQTHAQTVSASAEKAKGWALLGSRTVDYLIDRDEIVIDPSAFKELKFSIKSGPLTMHNCTLHFTDGSTKDVQFPEDVKASTERSIDLKGSYLKLDKVIFWYDTNNKSEAKAVVELWGKK